jgi:hypothetical protein
MSKKLKPLDGFSNVSDALRNLKSGNPGSRVDAKTRQHFTVTLAGERALAHAKETSKLLADFLRDFA